MLSLPIINALSTPTTRPDYLRWLKTVNADRVFLTLDGTVADPASVSDDTLALFAENVAFYRSCGFEVGIWINGLGHGGSLDPATANRTAHMTRIRDLETGAEIGDSFCPLDPAHRASYTANVARLASTHPDLIMVDDDLRLSGHGPVAIGCACERHIAAFNARAHAAGISDREVSREELAAVLFTGQPTPHRAIWMRLMGDTLRDFARDLRRTVDAVDPTIRLGHCAVLSTWGLDGVDSIELSRIFAGGTKPFLRLIGAAYWENVHAFRITNLGSVTDLIRMQTAWCRAYAPEIELMSEGDVYPRPRYNVPASYVEAYHQVLTADGLPDILKYMFDYGHEPDYETGYLRLHARKAPLRAAIAEAFADTEGAGVYVFEHMDKWPGADCTGLAGYECFDRFTPVSVNYTSCLGIPASYERTRYTPTTLVMGENAKYVPAEALQGNLILDAPAAAILLARGFAVGLASVEPMARPVTETLSTPARTFPVDTDGRFFRLTPQADAEILGVYDTGAPAVLACPLAGERTAVIYAFDMETVSFDAVYMKNDCRRRQVLDRLSDALPVDIPEPRLYVLCRRNEQKTVVGMWNFGRDIGLPQENIRVSAMGKESTVSPIGGGSVAICDGVVSYDEEIPPFCFGGFVVKHTATEGGCTEGGIMP